MHNFKNNNYILINIYNYKKSISNFDNKVIFNKENIKFYSKNKNNFIFVYFNLNNFCCEYDQIILFLNKESIFFDFMFIKYNYNFYSLDFFEKFFVNYNHFDIYGDIVLFSNLILLNKVGKNFLFLFIIYSIFTLTSNLNKCLLFIKQHQN